MMQFDRHALFQLLKYLIVGGTTAALYFTLLFVASEVWQLTHTLAVSLSYFISIAFHFLTNKLFTFKSGDGGAAIEVLRYLCVALLNYLITLVIVYLVVTIGHQSMYVGAAVAIAVTVGLGYVMTKVWVFQRNEG